MLVVSVVGETGILLFLLQKQLNTSANCLAFCYAVLLAVFRKILFCFSIQTDTVSNIFRLFYFWPPRAWGHSVSPLFCHTYIIIYVTPKVNPYSNNFKYNYGGMNRPPILLVALGMVGRVSRPPLKVFPPVSGSPLPKQKGGLCLLRSYFIKIFRFFLQTRKI